MIFIRSCLLFIAISLTSPVYAIDKCGPFLAKGSFAPVDSAESSFSERAKNLLRQSELPPINKENTDKQFVVNFGKEAQSQSDELITFNQLKQQFKGVHLSLENGSQNISQLRLHLPTPYAEPNAPNYQQGLLYSQDIFESLLKDLKPLLERQSQIQTVVVFPKGRRTMAEQSLRHILGSGLQSRVQWVEASGHFDLPIWAQDDSKPLQDGRLLVSPDETSVLMNMDTLSSFQLQRAVLEFEGGNIVVGERHLFIGAKQIADVANHLGVSFEQALGFYEETLSKNVFPVGDLINMQQIDYHADLTLAVGYSPAKSKEIVFLASAEKARQVYLQQLRQIARLGLDFVTSAQAELYRTEFDLIESFLTHDFSGRAEQNKKMKVTLQKLGYEVVEVPSFGLDKTLTNVLPKRINYLNTVISGPDILVPHYNLLILDKAAQDIYRSYGFNVIPARRSTKCLFKHKGGPRCALSTVREQN